MAGKIIFIIISTVGAFLFGHFQSMPIPQDLEENILWIAEYYPSCATNQSISKLVCTLKNYSSAFDEAKYQTRNAISTSTTVRFSVNWKDILNFYNKTETFSLQNMPYNPYIYFYESLILTSKDSQTEYRWRMRNQYWAAHDIHETYLDLLDGLEESLEPPPIILGYTGKTSTSFTNSKGTSTNPNTGFEKEK